MTENLATIGETPARTLQHRQMYIDGAWVDAVSGQTFETVNPYTGKPGPPRRWPVRPTCAKQ